MRRLLRRTLDVLVILLGISFIIQGATFVWMFWPKARYTEVVMGIGIFALGAFLASLLFSRRRQRPDNPPAANPGTTP